jgi:uncharacterized protein
MPMKNLIRLSIILLMILFLPLSSAYAQDNIKYPSPTESGYVNDYAGILNSGTTRNIVSIGSELDSKTKAQVVVVTIDKLPNDVGIEEYANGLFREWGIGDKKLNNGILLIVNTDPNARIARIEVGSGLEGRVPDAIANRIMEDDIIPYFKQGDYNSGILKGYSSLAQRVAAEYNVELSGSQGNSNIPNNQENVNIQRNSRRGLNLPVIIAGILFLLFDGILFRFSITRFLFYMFLFSGRRGRGGRGGGGFGGGSGGGGFGGFGGGSSSGGGSNGSW